MSAAEIINPDAWLSAVAEVTHAPVPDPHPDAITVAQFMDICGLKNAQASVKLQKLIAAGRAVMVKKTIRLGNGNLRTVNAYRLTPTDPPETKKRTRR